MPVTLNASTSSGLIATSDTSGSLELQSNGTTKATVGSTGLSIGQYNPSASLITSGTAVASTSGTSIDFTGIPSWVKRITVMLSGVSTNGGSNLLIQIGAGSVTSSGYTGSSTSTIGATIGSDSFTSGYGIRTGGSSQSAMVRQGSCTICLLGSNTWIESGVFSQSNEASNMYSAGSVSLGGTLDRVRITTSNGTDAFDAGSINILYE
jgi:hypothetical protein